MLTNVSYLNHEITISSSSNGPLFTLSSEATLPYIFALPAASCLDRGI